jgi:DNA replication initiation complex subunit (GINS family)
MSTAYDELVQAWKRELHNSDLQPLRQGFYKDVSAYVRRLREASRNVDAKSLKAIVLEEEMHRLEQMLAHLLDRRLYKLWAQTKLVQPNILEYSEKHAYEAFSGILRDYEKAKQDIMQGREPSVSKSKSRELVLVRFVKDFPSIIGVDLKAHGPFQKEDLANLPSGNAESLVRQGAAIEVRAFEQDNE